MAGYGIYTRIDPSTGEPYEGENKASAEQLMQQRRQLVDLFNDLRKSGIPGTEKLMEEFNGEKRIMSEDGDWNEMSINNTMADIMVNFLENNPSFLQDNNVSVPGLDPTVNLDPIAYDSMPDSFLGKAGLAFAGAGAAAAAGLAAGGLVSTAFPQAAAGGGGSIGAWFGPAAEATAPVAAGSGLTDAAILLGKGYLSSRNIFGEGGALSVEPPKTDDDLEAVLSQIDDILLKANSQNPGQNAELLEPQPVQPPPAQEVLPPNNSNPDGQAPDVLPTGGILDNPTQPGGDTTSAEQPTNNNQLLALLALLGSGARLGTSTQNSVSDPEFKPNIPNSTMGSSQPAFGDFDIPVHLPRLSLEQYRGKRLALPDFML